MIVRDIIQRIQSAYSAGVESDDTNLTPRHIYNKMLSARAFILMQKINKKQKISQWNYQTIHRLEMEEVFLDDIVKNPEICKVLKSVCKIPKPMTSNGMHMIQSVTTIDNKTVYNETSWTARRYKYANRFTSKKPDYYVRNDFLYLTDRFSPKYITFTALFENPNDAEELIKKYDTSIDICVGPMDKPFPLDDSDIEPLIELSIKELVIFFGKQQEDITNNSQDNEVQRSK